MLGLAISQPFFSANSKILCFSIFIGMTVTAVSLPSVCRLVKGLDGPQSKIFSCNVVDSGIMHSPGGMAFDGRQLVKALSSRNMSQIELAGKLRVSKQLVSGWIAGRSQPTSSTVAKLCSIFHVPKEQWFTEEERPEPATKKDLEELRDEVAAIIRRAPRRESPALPGPYETHLGERVFWKPAEGKEGVVKLPILDEIHAGEDPIALPKEWWEEVEWIEIPQDFLADPHSFALRVKGDSMAPALQNGDIVLVAKQMKAKNGDIVVALVAGEGVTVKRIYRERDGKLWKLNPDNESAEGFTIDWDEDPGNASQIIGKVMKIIDRRL